MKRSPKAPKRHQSTGDNQWIYGKHATRAILENPRRVIKRILVSRNNYNEMPQLANLSVEIVENRVIEALLPPNSVHQGIAIQAEPLADASIEDFCVNVKEDERHIVILLDQVTDPHNVGAVIRSAAAFGASAVITTSNNSAQESGTLAKSASGAMELVPFIRVTNLVSAIEALKDAGFWILGLDGYATDLISNAPRYAKTALIMGSEEKGLRRLTREHCDLLVKLPISPKVESLNVSNAAAISLYALSL